MPNPDFQWTRFYYPEIVAALLEAKAKAWPEHTESDAHDPVIQLLRLFALVGHQQAVRLDHVARELYLPTARLRSSFVALAALMDYRLALAVPARADVLADLNGDVAPAGRLLKAHTRFATEGTGASPAIEFEYLSDDDLEAVDGTGVYRLADWLNDPGAPDNLDPGGGGGSIRFHATPPALPAALWGGGLPADDGGGLLWLNTDLQFNRIGVELAAAWQDLTGVRWEYFDDSRETLPDQVQDLGGTIAFDVSTLVGTVSESDGLSVLVTCLRTGEQEWLETVTAGAQVVTSTTTLGQSTVSTNPADYTVRTYWPELPDVVDGTGGLQASGTVSWTLPQTVGRRWSKLELDDGASTVEGYAIRARKITAGGGEVAPTVNAAVEPSRTVWSLLVEAVQGRRFEERLGTTDAAGTASQAFTIRRAPLLELVSVALDDGQWTQVDNFLGSTTYDRHFTLIEDPNGDQIVTFGDGQNGRIPPTSSPVTAVYRIGGGSSGNVGATAIVRDRSGNGRLKNVRNPRAAAGWVAQEGTTAASLDALRAAIPASLRALERAVTPEDMEALAVAFRTEGGAQVAERAVAIEEGAGPKTVRLVVVAPGGLAPTAADLAELDTYFNGEIVGVQRIGGVALANTQVVPAAFVPRIVDLTANVTVLADYATGAAARITAALGAQLRPSARRLVLDEDGEWVTSADYLWRFEGTVSLAFLVTTIATAIPGIVNITITDPVADVVLDADELPVAGTIAITISEVA